MPYREGDFWRIDDRTGRKVLASRTVKEWTGSVVDRKHAIDLQRHPQEIQRIVNEKQSVDNPRPRPPDVFNGPIQANVLQRAEAGAVFLRLSSVTGFRLGDQIGVLLGNLDLWLTTIRQIYANYLAADFAAFSEVAFSEDVGPTTIVNYLEVASPLPWWVDVGALVVDYTHTIPPDVIDESQPAPNYTAPPAPVVVLPVDPLFLIMGGFIMQWASGVDIIWS